MTTTFTGREAYALMLYVGVKRHGALVNEKNAFGWEGANNTSHIVCASRGREG